jgi:hypothetical protein
MNGFYAVWPPYKRRSGRKTAGCTSMLIWYNRSTVATHPTPFDISNMPDLVRIVEEVKTTKQPRILKRDSEPVALLMPMDSTRPSKKKRTKSKADYEAFRAAAGSWKDVDVEQFKKNIYESRRRSTRPPVEL